MSCQFCISVPVPVGSICMIKKEMKCMWETQRETMQKMLSSLLPPAASLTVFLCSSILRLNEAPRPVIITVCVWGGGVQVLDCELRIPWRPCAVFVFQPPPQQEETWKQRDGQEPLGIVCVWLHVSCRRPHSNPPHRDWRYHDDSSLPHLHISSPTPFSCVLPSIIFLALCLPGLLHFPPLPFSASIPDKRD